MIPTFTILIGSKGRESLRHTLDSIARQERRPGDQCLVGIDAYEMPDHEIFQLMAFVDSYGEGFKAVPHIGIADEEKVIPPPWSGHQGSTVRHAGQPYHWLGVEQINNLLRTEPITGSHVITVGDDDVFVDDAYHLLRSFCEEDIDRPVIFKFLAPNRWRLWDVARMAPGLISGCCLAAPYRYVNLMHTRIETTHDYDWMMDILATARREPLWLNWVGVIARPEARGSDVTHRGIWECWNCHRWAYLEDVPVTTALCACGIAISPDAHLPKVVPAARADRPNAYMTAGHPLNAAHQQQAWRPTKL